MSMKHILLCGCVATLLGVTHAHGQDTSITFRLEVLSAGGYLQALTEGNWSVDPYAMELIEKFEAKKILAGRAGVEVGLEILTVGELGFAKGATLNQIFKRAASRNLLPCNPVDAVEFCRVFDNYNVGGQSLLIATQPTRCKDGKDYMFLLKARSQTRRVLIGWQLHSHPADNFFLPSAALVFERKKP
jgi:hypothetical protein